MTPFEFVLWALTAAVSIALVGGGVGVAVVIVKSAIQQGPK